VGSPTPVERRRGAGRRERVIALFVPERRTGFDRRRDYPVTGLLRDRPGLLLGVLIAINLLSALDFLATYAEVMAGAAVEANPVLAGMLTEAPAQAWLLKTTVMLLVSIGIWWGRKTRAVLEVAVGALALYVVLTVYHVSGLAASGLLWALLQRATAG